MSLRRQSADLLPVCDQLFSLHLNLSGAQRVGLLQAVSLGTQGFDLETHCVRTALLTLGDSLIESAALKAHLILQRSQISLQTLMLPKQSLNTGQVSAEVIGGH